MTLKSDAKFLRKIDLWFHIWQEKFGEFSPKHSKSLKISFRWTLFIQSVQGLSYKNTEVILHDTEQNLNKPWPCGFKNGMRNWANFH